jgi:hypothetical protein
MRAGIVLPLLVLCTTAQEQESASAFRFRHDKNVKASIDIKEVKRGVGGRGDPRDAIPAVREPKAIPAAKATWLKGDDRVLGMVVGKEARAYWLDMLMSHEMVNDVLGGVPVGPNY